MQEIDKSEVEINVMPNGLEKYMTFISNKILILVDSVQFMDSSLDLLVTNLTDNDFKYLSQEFTGEQLQLVKHIYGYMKIWIALKSFLMESYLIGVNFIVF